MKGMEHLTDYEVCLVASRLGLRDKAMFYLGVTTGFRITEILSLRVSDVLKSLDFNDENLMESVTVKRSHTKKQVASRTMKLVEPARKAILGYLKSRKNLELRQPLFASRKGSDPISRRSAFAIIDKAVKEMGIGKRIGTHSMRKTFAKKVYDATDGNYMKCKLALGHKSMGATEDYLQFIEQEDIKIEWEWL